MHYLRSTWFLFACFFITACDTEPTFVMELEPPGKGPHSVGSTNMEVASAFADTGDEAMHEFLLGRPERSGHGRYLADVLKNPDSAWITDVSVPEDRSLYGPASGQNLPVVTFLTYPSSEGSQTNSYTFPYHDEQYGEFENMLGANETPRFADPDARYPLIVLAHGANAHGIYDVGHAHDLSRHGYIVAVIIYGDDRTANPDGSNRHLGFLRPLITKAVIDSVLDSETFGPHVDADNIGISGHSFGGFTTLALAGGPIYGNAASVTDERIKAGVIAAPWVGHKQQGKDLFAFGDNNAGLNQVTAPVLFAFGTNDEVTLASYILAAAKQLSGPTYVIEFVDQPHVFEGGSWEDRNGWELLFFNAYLKHDAKALDKLKVGDSMKGGNEDRQLFDYQKLNGIE